MTLPAKVLCSARDPGGASHLLALVEAFQASERFAVALAASGAAYEHLRQRGLSPQQFQLPDGRDHLEIGEDPGPLLDAARRVLEDVKPEAVLVSLSSFGVGIDEALLATARVPTFAMQDFWGDVNLGLGTPAELYFVLDEEAAQLTRARWSVRAMAVGSPKHARYARLDIPAMRQATRGDRGIRAEEPLVGFFAQSPDMPGHDATFEEFVNAATRLQPRPTLLVRGHPKFPASRHGMVAVAEQAGLRVLDVTGEDDLESWLAACDVVATPFSACGLDHAYLSAYSPAPIGCVLYLLCNDPIRRCLRELSGLDRLPLVARGIGLLADEPDAVLPFLRDARKPESREAYFRASKSLPKTHAAGRVLETVWQAVGVAAGAGGA
jgi:hypothetical protein